MLPPGISEDPASAFFHDGLAAIEAKGRGENNAIPYAPRQRAVVAQDAIRTIHFD